MAKAEDSFTSEQRAQILAAIKEAEKQTSGEIRLFIENTCDEVLDRAAYIFKELKMHETKERNGVLIYVAIVSHKFAIIGDAGIHDKVKDDFWQEAKDIMQRHFQQGDFVTGLTKGIHMTGEKLKTHYPFKNDDLNELPDDIVYGNEN
jgi:uncharacterized membrane protein